MSLGRRNTFRNKDKTFVTLLDLAKSLQTLYCKLHIQILYVRLLSGMCTISLFACPKNWSLEHGRACLSFPVCLQIYKG